MLSFKNGTSGPSASTLLRSSVAFSESTVAAAAPRFALAPRTMAASCPSSTAHILSVAPEAVNTDARVLQRTRRRRRLRSLPLLKPSPVLDIRNSHPGAPLLQPPLPTNTRHTHQMFHSHEVDGLSSIWSGLLC